MSAPLCLNDSRLLFLKNFVSWLECWRALPTANGKLSPQTFKSFIHTCKALPLLLELICTKYGFKYLLTSRIQNDPLEHHFGLYRQMSGSQYQISYCQILESERRLQLSNILKLFLIKTQSDTIERPTSLLEYLSTFFHSNDDEHASSFDIESYLSALNEISLPEMATSQVECLAFVAGYAVFSYLKKSANCTLCRKFLVTEKSLQVDDDMGSQSILIELLDMGSLKYPSSHVLECIKVIFDIFSKIDGHKGTI